MEERVAAFESNLQRRRTVREFSDRPVPRSIIEKCLLSAGTAPSGAHQQPWHFVAIRPRHQGQDSSGGGARGARFLSPPSAAGVAGGSQAAGHGRAQAYLEVAPWVIAIFLKRFGRLPDGRKLKHYYTDESVGIATGLLIAAVHCAGLVSLTHTPNPMKFLNDILGRPPDIERPYMLLVVGYPAQDAKVPDIVRKPLADIASFLPG